MAFEGRLSGSVDVFCPLSRILIWTAAESRKQIQLEMIVSVDEPGKNEKPIQIEAAAPECCPMRNEHTAAADGKIDTQRFRSIDRYPRALQDHGLTHIPTQIAGTARRLGIRCCLPARSKIGPSGSSKCASLCA